MARGSNPSSPYIPNSDPKIKSEMMNEIGITSIDELYRDIPESSLLERELDLPQSLSEFEVRRDVNNLLSKNIDPSDYTTFLGGGTWPHHVPALVDEIINRSEFLTAYAGDTYSDLGRYQAYFEAHSMIGDLFGLDVVGLSTYDWATAAGDATRMAVKITNRDEVLVASNIKDERLEIIKNFTGSLADVRMVEFDDSTGKLDLEDLEEKITDRTAGVYFENPNYFGIVETNPSAISEIAHEYGAVSIAGVDPISLGVLRAPGDYGADIVCGEGQPLGMHMNYGGGSTGLIACRDEEEYVSEMSARLVTITTEMNGEEFGYNWEALPERNMFHERASTETIVGSSTGLWTIAAGVYLAVMGPQIEDLGRTIMEKATYAKEQINSLETVATDVFQGPYFKEFLVDFNETGHSVAEINEELQNRGIQGGLDLSKEFPELGEMALYCVTEVHSKSDIDELVDSLKEVVR